MPKTLADARTRLIILLTKPANPRSILLSELTAGIDASCKILKSDYRLSPTASDTVTDAELCAEGNAVTFGASNYEGSISPFIYLDDTGKSDTAAFLDEVSVPSLIVMGSKDPDFPDPVEEARSLASRINAETMIVAGAGHYPHVEMADEVGQRIIAFVRQLDKSGPAVVPLRRS